MESKSSMVGVVRLDASTKMPRLAPPIQQADYPNRGNPKWNPKSENCSQRN